MGKRRNLDELRVNVVRNFIGDASTNAVRALLYADGAVSAAAPLARLKSWRKALDHVKKAQAHLSLALDELDAGQVPF